MNHAHQGARAPGPLNQTPDPRVNELNDALRLLEAASDARPGLAFTSDPLRVMASANQRLGAEPLRRGLVIHALASLGWYRVQVGTASVPCCLLSHGGFLPLGVRDVGAIPPNSQVLVYKPRGITFGVILGALPPLLRSGKIVNPDWLVPGGQSGLRREALHRYPITGMFRNGGVLDFSGQRPLDSTALERGLIASTGIALLVDDYQAYLRVNEQCGLFLNYFDSHARLAAVQLDVSSIVHEESARDDEGESCWFRGIAAYPWEALGLPGPGTAFTHTYDDREVQDTRARAKIDLPEDQDDVQPAYRWQEYGGYLGQGHLRMLMRPAAGDGVRRHRDAAPDEGLYCESVALDGAYSVRSAKSITLARRVRIVVPRARLLPEDPTGDDAAGDNYRFSGQFGTAAAHRIGDVAVDGDLKSLRRVAAIDDFLAHDANWRTLHPFHYHERDHATAQEGDQAATFSRIQERLDFTALESRFTLPDPTPRPLDVDHRYGAVNYYERESFVSLLEDGGIVIGDGSGAQIVLAGGKVRIEAPGDVEICPGRDVLVLGDQVILRARQALDATVAQGDLRLKAERNMQLLAANAGTGALLLESKSRTGRQDFIDKVGEEVAGNGIVLKAAHAPVAALAGEIYLRTGGADLDGGDITLDAGKGAGVIQGYASAVNLFCSTGGVSFFYGPTGETSDVTKTYSFGPSTLIMDAGLSLSGPLIGFKNGANTPAIIMDGAILATGAITTAGSMASGTGGMVGKVPDGYGDAIQKGTDPVADVVGKLNDAGTALHAGAIVQSFYQANQLGNDDQVPAIGFTYRDPDSGDPYHTADLRWVERRWEQLVRLGGATGGHAWEEPPVAHAGRELYPWPGRRKWQEDDAFMQLESLTLYDPEAGSSRDRPDPYESAALASWQTTTMSSGYKLTRRGDA